MFQPRGTYHNRIRSSRRGKRAKIAGDHHEAELEVASPRHPNQDTRQQRVNGDLFDMSNPPRYHSIDHDASQRELVASGHDAIVHQDQPHVTDSTRDSPAGDAPLPPSYLGDSGFLPIFRPGGENPHLPCTTIITDLRPDTLKILPLLQQAFEETFQEYCYSFYPILDLKSDRSSKSVLLQQALAVLGSRLRPPVLEHDPSSLYYQRAKTLFYMNAEPDPLTRIVSVIFLQWMSAGPPNLLSLDSQYFWTGLAIRLAQEVGLYRDPSKLSRSRDHGLRRRIFWTLFVCPNVLSCLD